MTETLLLTRPSRQAEPIKTQLENNGFAVFVQPVIEIIPPQISQTPSRDETDNALAALNTFDYIIFTSRNAVDFFFERLAALPLDKKQLPKNVKFAAAGCGTAEALRQFTASGNILVPKNFSAEYLAEKLNSKEIAGKRFLFPCGNRRKDTLTYELRKRGGIVQEIEVYHSIDVQEVKPEIAAMMREGKFDWTTAMSPATAKSLVRLFGNDLQKTKIVSISPAVSQTLQQHGFTPALEAEQYSAEGMIAALTISLRKLLQ